MKKSKLLGLLLFFAPLAAFGQHQVVLTWTAPNWASCNCTDAGYNVYRAPVGGSSYTKIASNVGDPQTGSNATTYTDTTVTAGAGYTYYVTSIDTVGEESVPSNTTSVTIPSLLLNAPGGVTIQVAGVYKAPFLGYFKACSDFEKYNTVSLN